MRLPFSRALLCAALLSFSSSVLQAQISAPPSLDTGPPSQPTTPIDSFVSQTLLPLAEQALESSKTSDLKLASYATRFQELQQQRQKDNEERQKDLANWQSISETLALRVGTLQTYSDYLLKRLGDFSGSEEEKHRVAVAKLDEITAGAKTLETQNALLKYGMIGAVVVTAAAVIFAAVK